MKTLSITLFSTAVLTMCGLLILSQQSLAATKAKLTDVESKFIMEAAETSHAED